jgi:hypothetical protein
MRARVNIHYYMVISPPGWSHRVNEPGVSGSNQTVGSRQAIVSSGRIPDFPVHGPERIVVLPKRSFVDRVGERRERVKSTERTPRFSVPRHAHQADAADLVVRIEADH